MTTYPGVGDPLSAGVMADGTTISHLSEHGNLATLVVNAKKYLRGDGTTESGAQITALQTAGVGKHIYFPKGTYAFPDSTGMTLTTNTVVTGAGRSNTIITVKNAYAFSGTSTGDVDISGLEIDVRTAATTGGGVKLDSASQAFLHDLTVASLATCTEPPIWMKGAVTCHLDRIQAQGATANGIQLDATGSTLAFNNANSVRRCRVNSVQGSTNAAIYSTGGGGNRFRDNVLESNRGYGIYLNTEVNDTVDGIWFEDNSNHNIFIAAGAVNQIVGNKVHYNHGDIGAAEHIHVTGSASGRHMHRIEGNQFQDPSSSGVAVNIGAGVEFVSIIANRGAGKGNGTTITDNGSYTVMMGNDSGSTRYDDVKVPLTNSSGLGGTIASGTGGVFTVKGDSQTGDNGDPKQTGLFLVSDAAGEEYMAVTRKGYTVFHAPNGDPGSGQLPTNAFLFYWDEATQKVKARYRNNSGSESTAALF